MSFYQDYLKKTNKKTSDETNTTDFKQNSNDSQLENDEFERIKRELNSFRERAVENIQPVQQEPFNRDLDSENNLQPDEQINTNDTSNLDINIEPEPLNKNENLRKINNAEINLKDEKERKDFIERIYGNREEKKTNNSINNSDLINQEKQEVIKRPLPSVPTRKERIWIRIVISFLIIALVSSLSAFSWWWFIKTPRIVTKEIIKEIETFIEIPEIDAPRSFLEYDEFLEPIITNEDEVSKYLKQYIENEYDQGKLVKISIKNQIERTNPHFITLRDFLSSLKISTPSGFYDKVVHEDLNVFLYAGEQNDLGFIFPVKQEDLTELLGIVLATWDTRFESDFRNLYTIPQQKLNVVPPSTTHQRANIRCRNFGEGYQLCHASYKEKFIITTSLESVIAAINNFH